MTRPPRLRPLNAAPPIVAGGMSWFTPHPHRRQDAKASALATHKTQNPERKASHSFVLTQRR
ncbi:MAG TPA: hypothetical protein VEH77_07845, partial [Roseiarcus sp.]|nr:hypothetical protein [Roseiarcus sp.]